MTYYDFLKGIQEELEDKIVDFFEDKIKGRFPDSHCKPIFLFAPLCCMIHQEKKTTTTTSD